VGFTCFNWLILVTFSQGANQLNQLRQAQDRHGYWLMAAIATMIGLMAQGMVDTVWYRPQVNSLWWFAIAIVASFVGSAALTHPEAASPVASDFDKLSPRSS
jgi:putative inorganic carbon (hco3(-)) transporter